MSKLYDYYLERHRENVRLGFAWLCKNLPEILKEDCEWQIIYAHDQSKYESDEYEAYDTYFYGNNQSYACVQNFKRAWLLHIHRNPHHWQHWILVNDDSKDGEILLEIPYNYIVEMICDWWSFSWQAGNLFEIFNWYDEHRDYMRINPKSRKQIEDILMRLKERLGDSSTLYHHGVKGMKWGVRNGPPYPIDKSNKGDTIVKEIVKGHTGPSKRGTPNGIVDHMNEDGTIKSRAFYDSDGWKEKEIHTTNHGNPKHHSYGRHGEHIHYYEWDRETGKRINSKTEEIPDKLRRENEDIL